MYRIKKIYHFVVDAKIPTLSGSLCFFLLLNGGSYFFLFVSISSFFYVDFAPYIQKISDGILKDVFLYLLEHNSNLSTSLFLLGSSIYSSSSLYYHFMHISEIITKRSVEYKFGKRVLALLLVPIFLVITLAIFMIISFVKMRYFLFILFLIFILYSLNKLVLKEYPLKRLFKGVCFSLIYIIIFSMLFSIYLGFFSNFKIVYGILSFIIIFLFYIYSCCIGFFLGVYINCKNLDVFQFLIKEY